MCTLRRPPTLEAAAVKHQHCNCQALLQASVSLLGCRITESQQKKLDLQEGAKDRAHVHMEGSTPWLELLLGISGAFRPKVLTCLMGVTGAGKTTLMDVLAGRKTGERLLMSLLIGICDMFLLLILSRLATVLHSAFWQCKRRCQDRTCGLAG